MAAVSFPAQYAHARLTGGDGFGQLGGAVGAAVVDDDHLVIAVQPVEDAEPVRQNRLDVRLLVVGQQDDADGLVGGGR